MRQDPHGHLPIRSIFTSRTTSSSAEPLFNPPIPPHPQQAEESDSASTSSSGADLHVNDDEEFFNFKNDSVSSIAASIIENDTVMASGEMARPKENTHVLPPEILIAIFSRLSAPSDLLNCMKMSKRWARNSVELLWHRPVCNTWDNLTAVANAVVDSRSFFPYEQLIRRLNLSSLSAQISDGTLQPFMTCKRIERLTLTNCSEVGDQGIMNIVKGSGGLLALDITGLTTVSDVSIHALASNCPKLQGLNITGCRRVTDESLVHLAKSCRYLKRLKFNKCSNITDESVVAFAENCPFLLEVDLQECKLITDASVVALLNHSHHMRELRLAQCNLITDEALNNSEAFCRPETPRIQYSNINEALYKFDTHLMLESLRILDLTACSNLHDSSVERIIDCAPRLRILILAKCNEITDKSVMAICKLGKNLHDIHLGRCVHITDNALKELVKACNRIRYIDLAGCALVTDAAVKQLATLPKLRRIGLVKCTEITDRSIHALARASVDPRQDPRQRAVAASNLERVHLSYCINITLQGIHALLTQCPKLTHLSLTGIHAFFNTPEITQFCRDAPLEFNDEQRTVFCVFSGDGVHRLRDYLSQFQYGAGDHVARALRLHPPDATAVDGDEALLGGAGGEEGLRRALLDGEFEDDDEDDGEPGEEEEGTMLIDGDGGVPIHGARVDDDGLGRSLGSRIQGMRLQHSASPGPAVTPSFPPGWLPHGHGGGPGGVRDVLDVYDDMDFEGMGEEGHSAA